MKITQIQTFDKRFSSVRKESKGVNAGVQGEIPPKLEEIKPDFMKTQRNEKAKFHSLMNKNNDERISLQRKSGFPRLRNSENPLKPKIGEESPARSTDYGSFNKNHLENPQFHRNQRNAKSTFRSKRGSHRKFGARHVSIEPKNNHDQDCYDKLGMTQVAVLHHFDSIRIPKPGFKSFDSNTQKFALKDVHQDFCLNIQIDKIRKEIKNKPKLNNTAVIYTKLLNKQQLKTFEFQDPDSKLVEKNNKQNYQEQKITDYKVWNKLKKKKLKGNNVPSFPSNSSLGSKIKSSYDKRKISPKISRSSVNSPNINYLSPEKVIKIHKFIDKKTRKTVLKKKNPQVDSSQFNYNLSHYPSEHVNPLTDDLLSNFLNQTNDYGNQKGD
ncbi:unnamed protein product [Moneuplotes crassus]|uniref:Uncharacterized protein n=1 Tax=Euplotes crassus TaxID=5936 RepID=A0AAD1U8A2_EUPCR|nr:unnamed protein product [Moneuplotes crassus]